MLTSSSPTPGRRGRDGSGTECAYHDNEHISGAWTAIRKAYERLTDLAYQVDPAQKLAVAFAQGFHPAKGSPEAAAIAAEKEAAAASGRLLLSGPLGEQSQRAIDRHVEQLVEKGDHIDVTVAGDTSAMEMHDVLRGLGVLHPGKSITVTSQHAATVADFPGGPPRATLRDPVVAETLGVVLAKDFRGVKSASFAGDVFVVRATSQFDTWDAKDVAKTARLLLGDQAAVRIVRDTEGELPSFVVTNGYPAQVFPDGTKSAFVVGKQVPDELVKLGVTAWDSNYGRAITLRMPDTATAAEAMQASRAAARITGSDYAQVWFSGSPEVSRTGAMLAAPVRVSQADREAFAQGILDAHPHAHSANFYGAWPKAKDGAHDDPAYQAELKSYLDAQRKEGFVDAEGVVVNVEPWFDAANVQALVADVRARLATVPGFDAAAAQDVRVDVRRKIDGSEVNRGQGGWAVVAQTNPGPEPYERFRAAKA